MGQKTKWAAVCAMSAKRPTQTFTRFARQLGKRRRRSVVLEIPPRLDRLNRGEHIAIENLVAVVKHDVQSASRSRIPPPSDLGAR